MDKQERSALTAALCNVVRDYVAKSEEKSSKWVNGELRALTELFEERLKAIPEPRRGERGEKGESGEAIRGEKGEPGESIVGERGPQGERGLPGESIKGERGEKGEDGRSVSVEAVRLMVLDELRKELALIPKAKDGRDGLDALQLDILPAIDPARTYLRGTYARHNGGLVRYKENDWEVITNGIASINEEQTEDPRDIRIVITQTSGEQCVIERHIPLPLYCGVYGDELNSARVWMRGDTASHGGSVWHCNINGAQSRPGTPGSREWTLMVKEGRRGKDGEPPKSNGNGSAPVHLR